MLRKLLLALTALALVGCIVLTGFQFVPFLKSLEFEDPSGHFTRAEKRYTVTAEVEEGGRIDGIAKDYAKGEQVNLIAVANDGYIFNGWYSTSGKRMHSSPYYSFSIDKDKQLHAKFVPAPKDASGEYSSDDAYAACDEDFSFTVYCGITDTEEAIAFIKEYLIVTNAALAGTEYEDLASVSFDVTPTQNPGEYTISPMSIVTTAQSDDGNSNKGGKYAKGVTYSARFKDSGDETKTAYIGDANGEAESLTFTIASDNENSSFEYNSDVKFVYADDVILKADGYFLLSSANGISKKDVVCVYTETDGSTPVPATSVFAKVASIEQTTYNGTDCYKLTYTTPSISEIFKSADFSYKETLDLTRLEFSEDVEEQIRTALLSSESFQNYIARSYQVLSEEADALGYSVTLASEEEIHGFLESIIITPSVYVDGDYVVVMIDAEIKFPIKNKSTGQKVSELCIEFQIKESAKPTPHASFRLLTFEGVPKPIESYNIGISVDTITDTAISVRLDYDGEGLEELKSRFSEEIEGVASGNSKRYKEIQSAFADAGFLASAETRIKIAKLPDTTFCGFSFGLDLDIIIDIDANASIEFSSTSTGYVEYGVRSGKGGRPDFYQYSKCTAKGSALTVSGKAGIKAGMNVKAFIALAGLENIASVDLEALVGVYANIAGCASINEGYYAARLDCGFFAELELYYNLFSSEDEIKVERQNFSVINQGFDSAIIGYAYAKDIEAGKTVSLYHNQTKLSDFKLLKLVLLDINSFTVTESDIDYKSDDYTISVKFGSGKYLSYKTQNGKLVVANDAPAYFKDTITITLKPANSKWGDYKDGAIYVSVPTITVNVEFGNEDKYYESIDNDIQKEFRRLYRSYNGSNADILRDSFEEMIESFVKIPENQKGLYRTFTSTYLKNLFNVISEYRAIEDDKRTQENIFVNTEANAFNDAVNLFYEASDGKDIEENRAYALLEKAEATKALYDSLIEVAYSDDKALTEQLEKIGPKTRARIEQEINEYDEMKAGNERSAELAEAARYLFGFKKDTPKT